MDDEKNQMHHSADDEDDMDIKDHKRRSRSHDHSYNRHDYQKSHNRSRDQSPPYDIADNVKKLHETTQQLLQEVTKLNQSFSNRSDHRHVSHTEFIHRVYPDRNRKMPPNRKRTFDKVDSPEDYFRSYTDCTIHVINLNMLPYNNELTTYERTKEYFETYGSVAKISIDPHHALWANVAFVNPSDAQKCLSRHQNYPNTLSCYPFQSKRK